MTFLATEHRRYLRLLGVAPPVSGLDGLRAIVRAHVTHVPFENLSKLVLLGREGRGRPFTLAEFLDGIEHSDLGGTCYSSNPFLAELLGALGYDADLIGADMSALNVHTSIRVRTGGREYHVDCGFGAPFLEPVALDRLPHEIVRGTQRYTFRREEESVVLESWSGAEPDVGYRAHGPAWNFDFFRPVILDSFQPGRHFVSLLRVVRIFEDHTVELTNRTVTRHDGQSSRQSRIGSLAEMKALIAQEFEMPRAPLKEAVDTLARLAGKRLFP